MSGDPDRCATTHRKAPRLQTAQHDHIKVELTAVIADDGEPLSTAHKVERTHAYILRKVPTGTFLDYGHEMISLDMNAQSAIRNATNNRPTDPAIIGYAGKMSAPAKTIRASLDPDKGKSSFSVADFGRPPLAPLHAATAGLASSAMGMKDYSRINFSALTSKVAAAAKCHDKNPKQK